MEKTENAHDKAVRLDALKKSSQKLTELKSTIVDLKEQLRDFLISATIKHVSAANVVKGVNYLTEQIRSASKDLRKARLAHNELYFGLGGEKGAKNIRELIDTFNVAVGPGDEQLADVFLTGGHKDEEVDVDIIGYLDHDEVRSLINAMMDWLTKDSGQKMFECRVKINNGDLFITPSKES